MHQHEIDVVFLIADLSGYTALTEAHGGIEAARIVTKYVGLAQQALASGARLVERVGDEVLVVADTAAGAAQTAIRIREAVEKELLFPGVRVGIHGGRVVEQEGRYFGPALNLTARVAAHAHEGQVLCTDRIAFALNSHRDLACRSLGMVRFKNVPEPVGIHEVVPRTRPVEPRYIDPVCRMQVRPETAPARMPYGSATYYFCSFECAKTFIDRPDSYVE